MHRCVQRRGRGRAVASLSLPGGQDRMISSIFPHLPVASLIFPQFFFIFFLILIFRVGGSSTLEGPGYATGAGAPAPIFDDGGKEPLGEFKIGGSVESLVEMVQIEKSFRSYVNFTLWKGLSWGFKTLNPWASGGSAPWTPARGVVPWIPPGF